MKFETGQGGEQFWEDYDVGAQRRLASPPPFTDQQAASWDRARISVTLVGSMSGWLNHVSAWQVWRSEPGGKLYFRNPDSPAPDLARGTDLLQGAPSAAPSHTNWWWLSSLKEQAAQPQPLVTKPTALLPGTVLEIFQCSETASGSNQILLNSIRF